MRRRPGPQLVVEFVGIPGAGKTQIASMLARELAARFDVAFPDRFEYRRWSLRGTEALRLDLRHLPAVGGYRLRRLFFDLHNARPGLWVARTSWRNSRYPAVLLDKMRRDPHRIYVLDEWMLHRAIEESIRRYGSSHAFSSSFSFPPRESLPMTYVCVELDPARACERVLASDNAFRWFARGGDRSTIERTLEQWHRQIEALRPEMRRRASSYLVVDGAQPAEANARRLAEALSKSIDEGARAGTGEPYR